MDERVIVSRDPFNAETRLDLQVGPLTPNGRHYVRSHFAAPDPRPGVAIGGAVGQPRAYELDELRAMPARTATITLECAGNGRAFLAPPVPGEQWRLGAVSTAEWTGVTLRSLLEPRGLSPATVEILFRGADRGTPAGTDRRITYERSLPIDRAISDDVLVAYAMNGAPIPPEHGAPIRLVVPTWYGMASVKWLAEIEALEVPFRGFYQRERYIVGDRPLRTMRPRAVIVSPLETVAAGARTAIRGYAWSGHGPVARVEVSTDGGRSWTDARLGPAISPAAWREWTSDWTPSRGTHELIARAMDAAGEAQPVSQRHDPLGYENNAAQPTRVVAA